MKTGEFRKGMRVVVARLPGSDHRPMSTPQAAVEALQRFGGSWGELDGEHDDRVDALVFASGLEPPADALPVRVRRQNQTPIAMMVPGVGRRAEPLPDFNDLFPPEPIGMTGTIASVERIGILVVWDSGGDALVEPEVLEPLPGP